ncbi:MAG: right-handed parallel beta-helix repeat-containing protein [Myxococcota bacterium]
MRLVPLFALLACTGPKDPADDTAPVEETAAPDTEETAIETGDSSPPVETGETAETDEPFIDNDGDGVSPDFGDCNDADPLVYAGAPDVVCDGVDADCDGVGVADAFVNGERRHVDLATALAGAVDGDTIDVCPGIWVQNVTLDTPMTLTLRGWSGTNADTELDGGSLGPVLTIGPGVNLTIEDLGLVNGVATWQDEDVEQSGGAIWADDAFLTLRRARFTNNTSQDIGGGVAIRLGDPASGLVVEACDFTDNRASSSGGAIAVLGSGAVTITDTTFTSNRAPNQGGAVHLDGAPLTTTVTDCAFVENSTSGRRGTGGAIAGEGDEVSLIVTGTTFSSNTSGADGAAIGMLATRSSMFLDSDTFSANSATDGGGAVQVDSEAMDLELVSCLFDGNLASTQGGAVELMGGGTAVFDTVTTTNNSGGNAGGAYYLDEGDGLTLVLVLDGGGVTTNRAGIGGGGGVYSTGARVEATTVDFGADAATNSPEDVYGCASNFTTSATFVFDESIGALCQ